MGPRDQMPGAALYQQHCAHCHSGAVERAPHFIWLEMMPVGSVLQSLESGVMRSEASSLSAGERAHIAEYITRTPVTGAQSPTLNMCPDNPDKNKLPSLTGWGHDTSRYVSSDDGGITADEASNLKLRWTFAYPGALRARSQPSVGYNTLYTGSQDGTVYAFDLETGCVRWTYKASAEVRTGIVLSDPRETGLPLAIFGDLLARIHVVNAITGELIWSKRADAHPSATLTATPAVDGKHVYFPVSSLEVVAAADPGYACCTFRGKVMKLELTTGNEIWTHYSIPDEPQITGQTSHGTDLLAPSGAPVWGSPTIDKKRNRLYFGTGENYSTPADEHSDAIIAVDLTTGNRIWQKQSTAGDAWNVACMMEGNPNCPPEDGPDFDHGSQILLVNLPDGKNVLAAGHKNGNVIALDPDNNGEVLWQVNIGRGSIQGGIHFGMAADGEVVYAPVNDMNDTRNGDVLDPALAKPGLSAVNMATGEVMWTHVQPDICDASREFCDPGISAPVSASEDVVIAGHLDGYIRAYSKSAGDVLFEYNAATPHTDVHGNAGKGGSMSGAGPTIAEKHVIVNSGYGLYFHEPGNLLLVFSPET